MPPGRSTWVGKASLQTSLGHLLEGITEDDDRDV